MRKSENFQIFPIKYIKKRTIAKKCQKMSGGFRRESGSEMYCSIMAIVETLKKKKMRLIENIIYKEFIYGYTGYFLAGVKSS